MSGYVVRYLVMGDPVEVSVKPVTQQGKRVWRSKYGVTYSDRYIRTFEELTTVQKVLFADAEYRRRVRAIEAAIAKDPTLEEMRKPWTDAARREARAAIDKAVKGAK